MVQLCIVPVVSRGLGCVHVSYLALSRDRYKVQAIPQVDWKGTRYWIGMRVKLTAWIAGHTFQLASRAAGG